jgi:methylated-DNA-protein-cysteine methyltransferase-like protein
MAPSPAAGHLPQVSSAAAILAAVRRIPKGKAAAYGQVARLAGLPRRARLVGHVLQATEQTVPWHRVVNASWKISPREPLFERQQRVMLEQEGVKFSAAGVIRKPYRWSK